MGNLRRLAELETKLAAFPPAGRPEGDKLRVNAIEAQPYSAVPVFAAVPSATATEQVASRSPAAKRTEARE